MGPQQLPTTAGFADAAIRGMNSLMNPSAVSPTDTMSSSTNPIAGINFADSLRTNNAALQSPSEAIDRMLGEQMTADQTLRMIIALLILQMLLNQESGNSGSQSNELDKIAGGLEALGRGNQPVIFTSTSIVQMQFQSTLVYAEFSSSNSENTGGETQGGEASRLDVTA